MQATTFLSEEERRVDPQLGYPRGYAKLCRNAATQLQGLITPFTQGPPQRFMPYAPQPEEIARLKELDSLFPVISEDDRDPPNARKYADFLWRQLDSLGNAGFDPAKFRVDMFGNVLYWHADAASPLAWEIDHWFPHSRGGKTVMSNLRVLQWQTNQRKANRLEFLLPWWDLQLGVSVNQFLSAFASRNSDFRRRSLQLFFADGEDEQAEGRKLLENHSFPAHFRERKVEIGLAAAAIVTMTRRDTDDRARTSWAIRAARDMRSDGSTISGRDATVPTTGTPARRRWTIEEEEALRRAVQKFGPGSWKEIKENEPALASRSTVQIKDKYRLLKGDWHQDKENATTKGDKDASLAASVQRETRLKQMREEEKRAKEEEIAHLQETLNALTQENEAEFLALEDLEALLIKNKEKVEKQRRWSETQSSYRICLERMIRDTMHQSVNFKEQARLNQAACNALMVRLDCQKQTSVAAGTDLVKKFKQREELLALACPDQPAQEQPLLLEGLDAEQEEELLLLAGKLSSQDDEPSGSQNTANHSLPSLSEGPSSCAATSDSNDQGGEEVNKLEHINDSGLADQGGENSKSAQQRLLQPLDIRRSKLSRADQSESLVQEMAKLTLGKKGDGIRSRETTSGQLGASGKRSFDEEREKPGRLSRDGGRVKKMKKLDADDKTEFGSDFSSSRNARISGHDLRRVKFSKATTSRTVGADDSRVSAEPVKCSTSAKETQAHDVAKGRLAAKDSGCTPWIELERLNKCDKASRVTEWLDAVQPPRFGAQYRYAAESSESRSHRDVLVCPTSKQLLVELEAEADSEAEADVDDGEGTDPEVDVVVVGFEYTDVDKGVVLARHSAPLKTECLETGPTEQGACDSSRAGKAAQSRRTFAPAAVPTEDTIIETANEEQKKVIVVESPQKASDRHTTKLDDILQEMLDAQLNRSSDQQGQDEDELGEDEKIRQLGKSNLDKWLHVLLHKEAVATLEDEVLAGEDEGKPQTPDHQPQQQTVDDSLSKIKQDITSTVAQDRADLESQGQKPTGLLVGLLKKLSFRQPLEPRPNLRASISVKAPDVTPAVEQKQQLAQVDPDVLPVQEPNSTSAATGPSPEDLSSLEDLSYAQTEGSMSSPPSKAFVNREEWDMGEHARSGLKASIKACTVAWRRAVKKMEPRPLTPSWGLL